MNRFPIPNRRPRSRFYRFPPAGKTGPVRRLFRPRNGLLALSALLLALFVLQAVRSARTAERNRTYAEWHEEAEKAAYGTGTDSGSDSGSASNSASGSGSRASAVRRMTKPDGSPVVREEKQSAGRGPADTVTDAVYHKASGAPLPAMGELRRRNRDLIAWLEIDGVLDLPVVYRDNTWYLNHDFEGIRNPSGTLFLDEAHPLTERTQTLLIHGHNMKDGSMFAQLTHYQKADWCRRHPLIHLTTMWERETYMVFAVVRTPTDPSSPEYINFYTHRSFASDQAFEDYIRLLQSRSCFHSGLTVGPEDALLQLATCIGEERLIVAARRLGANESKNTVLSSQQK